MHAYVVDLGWPLWSVLRLEELAATRVEGPAPVPHLEQRLAAAVVLAWVARIYLIPRQLVLDVLVRGTSASQHHNPVIQSQHCQKERDDCDCWQYNEEQYALQHLAWHVCIRSLKEGEVNVGWP